MIVKYRAFLIFIAYLRAMFYSNIINDMTKRKEFVYWAVVTAAVCVYVFFWISALVGMQGHL